MPRVSLLAWSLCLVVALAAAGRTTVPTLQAVAPTALGDRPSEPVTLEGAALASFRGAATNELSAWAWSGSGWRLMHAQVDERSELGGFVAVEDGALDDNDELVLASGEFGGQRAGVGDPSAVPPGSPYYEIVITDPLTPGSVHYAYVYWTAGQVVSPLEPLIGMDVASGEIRSAAYVLGFAQTERDGFVGIARLSLHGRPEDLLDRMKIRLRIEGLGIPVPLTEAMLATFGFDVTPEPVVNGPVRLLFDRRGQSWADAHHLRVLADFAAMPGLGQVPVRDIRLSFDLSREALPATYRDANIPEGVAVDGRRDAVPSSPLPAWREVRTAAGRFVMLTTVDVVSSTATVYYKDETGFDLTDTGDMASLGDQGVAATDLAAFASAGFPGLIVVPPAESQVPAPELLRQVQTPLEVEVRAGPNLPTPGPTRPPATALPTRSATIQPGPRATASATPTVRATTTGWTPAEGRLCLPLLFNNT